MIVDRQIDRLPTEKTFHGAADTSQTIRPCVSCSSREAPTRCSPNIIGHYVHKRRHEIIIYFVTLSLRIHILNLDCPYASVINTQEGRLRTALGDKINLIINFSYKLMTKIW